MRIELTDTALVAYREPGDPQFYGAKNAAGESRLFAHIVRKLREMGHDVIKKRAAKDGHLLDDMQQYIRERKGAWCAYNHRWAIEGAEVDWNREGKVELWHVALA